MQKITFKTAIIVLMMIQFILLFLLHKTGIISQSKYFIGHYVFYIFMLHIHFSKIMHLLNNENKTKL